jgi:hypothetical protein
VSTDEINDALNKVRKESRKVKRSNWKEDPLLAEKAVSGAVAVTASALLGGPTLGILFSGMSLPTRLALAGLLTGVWGAAMIGSGLLFGYLLEQYYDEYPERRPKR